MIAVEAQVSTTRLWMANQRLRKGKSLAEMAERIKCSTGLLMKLEAGEWITTPKMAKDIAKAYGMTKRQLASITYVPHRAKKVENRWSIVHAERKAKVKHEHV